MAKSSDWLLTNTRQTSEGVSFENKAKDRVGESGKSRGRMIDKDWYQQSHSGSGFGRVTKLLSNMIIKNKRSLTRRRLPRIFKPWAIVPPPGIHNVLSAEKFEVEIAKERFRANRRVHNREFSVIWIDFSDRRVDDQKLNHFITRIDERLRISDSIGWSKFRLATLLPETAKEGACIVANGLISIAKELEIDIDTEVAVYPWDDTLLSSQNDSECVSSESDGMDLYDDVTHVDNDSVHRSLEQPFEMNGSNSMDFGTAYRVDSAHNVAVAEPIARTSVVPRVASVGSPGTGLETCFLPVLTTPLWKRTIDVVGAGTGLVMLSPVLLAAAAMIRITSPGPVFFRQQREGKNGQVFDILKFRTMGIDAEQQQAGLRGISEQDGPAFKLTNDPRVTKVGKYLRKSCVDELPQLLNVIRGQMSLVGPRPLPVEESRQCLSWQRQRLSVLPGITCIWQAAGNRETGFAEWMRMDMEYIRRRGFAYDLRLIARTAFKAVLHRGSV